MNIAERIRGYYDHEDFKGNYGEMLVEQLKTDEATIIERIIEIGKYSCHFNLKYGENFVMTPEQAKQIYDYILGNFEDFIKNFSSYYVGDNSLGGIAFGEQEEQLKELFNNLTGKNYTMKYLKRIFDEEGFYVSNSDWNKNCAYYDLSDTGIHVDMLSQEIPFVRGFITEENII